MRRGNVQHGQRRRYVSMGEMVCLGVIVSVAISAFMLLCAPSIGGS